MEKGISPIVAVVLLIAIAVIAAVGLYFWLGGLATKQGVPSAPRTITASISQCGSVAQNYTTVVISNTSPEGSTAIQTAYDLIVVGGSGDEIINMSQCNNQLRPGQQAPCRIDGFVNGDGQLIIYGKAGKNIASTTITC